VRRLAPVVLAAGLALGGAACGTDELAPVITALRYVDQVPQEPLVLRLSVVFTDADGDLGLGTLHLTVDGEERSELPVDELFATQMPALPRDSTAGRFEVQVELQSAVQVGQDVELGLWLVDRRGGTSNAPTITLRATALASGLRAAIAQRDS
jgi:hypothetical protein